MSGEIGVLLSAAEPAFVSVTQHSRDDLASHCNARPDITQDALLPSLL